MNKDNTLENIIEEARAEGYEQAENDEPNFLTGKALDRAAAESVDEAIEGHFITQKQAQAYADGFIAGYNDFIKSIKGN